MLLNRPLANEIMDREELDGFLAVTDNNVYYLSGYESDFLYDIQYVAAAVLPRKADIPSGLCVPEIEAANLIERPTWMDAIHTYYFDVYGGVLKIHTFAEDVPLTGDDAVIKSWVDELDKNETINVGGALNNALKAFGKSKVKIGIDDTRFAAMLATDFPNIEFVEAAHLFIECRMIKIPDEIKILRSAARMNETALRKAFAAIKEDATWLDVRTAYEVGVAEQGARVAACYNGAGEKSAGAERVIKKYPIAQGDQVCFDSLLKWQRYVGDCQRTVVLGEPSEKLQRYWNAFEVGIEDGYSKLKPGVSTMDLRNQTIETVRKAGIPSFCCAFIHGIGLDHIEMPFSVGGKLGDFTLQENMVLNMDMEVHEIGWGGTFFEETMLITKDGAERLYTLERQLFQA